MDIRILNLDFGSEREGRYFTDLTESKLKELVELVLRLETVEANDHRDKNRS